MFTKETRLCILMFLISDQFSHNEAEHYRLPDNVIPFSYILRLQFDDMDTESVSGSVVISFNTNEEASNISLHASLDCMNITNIALNADFNKLCNISSHNIETGIVTVSCPEKTITGDSNTLQIHYQALVSQTTDWGIYRTKVNKVNENAESIIATQLAPSFARRLFPCFDEPRFKATFDLFITHPDSHEALANSPISVSSISTHGMAQTEFYTTPPMSTYLLGFVIGKFQHMSANATDVGMIYSVFTRPDLINYTSTALHYGPQLVQSMGYLTGIQYKDMEDVQLYQIALPELKFPAVENWGLLTYRETEILDDAEKTTELMKQNIISVMAHQISHQWFGNYATLDWWSNSWLNEGFATYFQYYLPDKVDGLHMDLDKQFTVNVLQDALRDDAYPDSPALSGEDIDNTTIDDYFKKADYLTHGKGASVIRMMKSVLGDEKFQEGIKLYLQVNKFNTTNPTSLLESFRLGNLMEPWIYKPGYPLLHVELKDNNQVQITQEPFSNSKNARNSNNQWNIPVTYTTSEEKNFDNLYIDWLKKDETFSVELKEDAWILLNIQQIGFYRVVYDDAMWERLIVALNEERTSIHVLNRAQLIDDAFSLSWVGKINYIDVFRLTDFLLKETEYPPWCSALKAISYMMNHVTDQDTIELLKSRTIQYIETAFPSLRKTEENSHMDTLKETMILKWKCELGNEDCIEYAKKSFQDYQQLGRLSDSNERSIILCYGAKHSTNLKQVYYYLLPSFESATSVIEREDILMAVGCIPDKTILSSFLGETVYSDSAIPRVYSPTILRSVLSNVDYGCDVALDFLERNLKMFIDMHGELFPISTVLSELSEKIRTEEQLIKLKQIITNCRDIPDTGKILNRVDYHMKWNTENAEKIKTSLREHTSQGIVHSPLFLRIISLSLMMQVYRFL